MIGVSKGDVIVVLDIQFLGGGDEDSYSVCITAQCIRT